MEDKIKTIQANNESDRNIDEEEIVEYEDDEEASANMRQILESELGANYSIQNSDVLDNESDL